MGIITTVKTSHFQTNLRSDNTDVKVKWKAVELQEAHYKTYYNIRLRWYREHMDLKNNSWNGAVRGLLLSPPEGYGYERQQYLMGKMRPRKKGRRGPNSRTPAQQGEKSPAMDI